MILDKGLILNCDSQLLVDISSFMTIYILINVFHVLGDHQQLRPSATVYELATKYGLETSLFERMIKNGLA